MPTRVGPLQTVWASNQIVQTRPGDFASPILSLIDSVPSLLEPTVCLYVRTQYRDFVVRPLMLLPLSVRPLDCRNT